MESVSEWLRGLGLSQYAARFAENDIDISILPHLTDQDLERLGVASLGHRRKLLHAISILPAAAPVPATEPQPQDSAERRHLTVMFSDLVGSTALAARMDPEDMREVIAAYQTCVAETVRRFDGFVAKYMGDGVLIYFGYPRAHEDDAERAARAGLELVTAVSALKSSVPLQVRVGIATGLVVVGDLIGSGEAQERGIVGETPNLAARLQGLAAPNTVVIADATRRLAGGLFELADLGLRDLKGIEGPVRAWTLLRPRSVESRFEALHAGDLAALIGREEETEILHRRWQRAKSGDGQVVLLSGEPGIGKSRLTATLLERLAGAPHTRLRYFCSPQRTDSALHPIIGHFERAAGFAPDDDPRARLDKLDALLARTTTPPESAALLAEMLSLPNDGRYPALELSPPVRRQTTFEALTVQLEALSRQAPVLMIFEDVHWIDPTSLEALGRVVDRAARLPLLLLVTFRPEFAAPWIGQPHVTALTLNRLARREVEALIDRLVGNKPLPAGIRQDIIERTDGIPLFVEEMTKAVLEAESESAARRTVGAAPSPASPVPASLHASLMARLDRLGAAKEAAQIGAAIGREFSHGLLAAVARWTEHDLRAALDRLVGAGLLFQQGTPPDARYLFKHALVQDAAYGTLLREPRRALHARIAEALESRFCELVESQPDVLAHHCTEAGQIEKAAGLWGKAGKLSLERSALVEATAQLDRALAQIETLPETAARRSEETALQFAHITALASTKGWASPEIKPSFARARALVQRAAALEEPSDDPLLPLTVLGGFWAENFVTFNGDALRELAKEMLAFAEEQGATAPLFFAYTDMGVSLLYTGEIAAAREYFDQAIALHNPAEPLQLPYGALTDFGVFALIQRSRVQWLLGYTDAALSDAEHALRRARELDHATSLTDVLSGITSLHRLIGDDAAAAANAQELIALAEVKGSAWWTAMAMMQQGALAVTGKASDAIQILSAGIAAWRSTGATLATPTFLPFLAMAHAALGQDVEAWRCVDEALVLVETNKETWWEAEIHRTAGEVMLMSPEPDAAIAQAHFDRALAIARAQRAKSWELRAATSMARLWRDQGKRQQARDLLAPVYGWFTEGFETLDLRTARALLEELE
jgi:class 3 adenylate cyclase/predicted ATPase